MAYHPVHYIENCLPKNVHAEMLELAIGFSYQQAAEELHTYSHYYHELAEWAREKIRKDCKVRVLGDKGYSIQKFLVGQGMGVHQDSVESHKYDGDFTPTMTMVYYLNDNYDGGELCLSRDKFYGYDTLQPRDELFSSAKSVIKPKANSCVIFDAEMHHWVVPVTSGERYSYTIFYNTEDHEMDKTKITKMTMEEFRLSKEAEDSAAEAAETAARKTRDTPYWEFIEKIKNPPHKCVMHDEAVNAANLIEMWRGVAETLYFAILETAGGEGIDAYNWAWGEEQRIINSKGTQ